MNDRCKQFLSAVVFLALCFVVTFWRSLNSDLVLFTSDDPLGVLSSWKRMLPIAWMANWVHDHLVGLGSGQSPTNVTNLLLFLLPLPLFANWAYALAAFGAGVFFFLFLRRQQRSVLASAFGALIYGYCGINFSLVHSGHLGKFGCYVWFAATLWALECSLNRPKAWSWRIVAGGFLGLTVSEQPDLAILFVWLFVIYLFFRVMSVPEIKFEKGIARFVGLLALSGVVSGLVAANVVLSQYQSQVKGVAHLSEENKQQGWEWATQWSYPPEETLELVAPGFFGWSVSSPTGPYWGRTGQSAGYEETKQGFSRFKLDTSYVGIVPIFLAASIGVFAFRKRYREVFDPSVRLDLIFWSVVAVVTLLLAFGKFFLLYHFFYAIPKMNIIRNPNKFMHLFAIAIAILSAYGFQFLLEQRDKRFNASWLWKILAGIAVAAVLGAIYISSSNQRLVASFTQEFQNASPVIVANMSNALLRLAVSSGIFAVLCFWLTRATSLPATLKVWAPRLVILLATVDLYVTNRHYVEYYEWKPMYAANNLIQFLKNDPEPHRCKILPRDPRHRMFGLYNNWLTFLFPYHRIQTLDIPQMPRMPVDYQQYLAAMERNPLRYWELANCKYLIGPAEFWPALQADPLFQNQLAVVYAYNLAMSNNVIVTAPVTDGQATQNTQVIIRVNRALPRMKFYDRWLVIPDDKQCLQKIVATDFDPQSEVIVSESLAPQTNAVPSAAAAKVEWLHRTDNVAQVRVTTDRPGILLFNEKHDPNFLVTVDGQPAQLLRCNYIMKGVRIESGTHEVRFEYRPPRIGFYASITGWIGCLVAVPLLRLWEQRSK